VRFDLFVFSSICLASLAFLCGLAVKIAIGNRQLAIGNN